MLQQDGRWQGNYVQSVFIWKDKPQKMKGGEKDAHWKIDVKGTSE